MQYQYEVSTKKKLKDAIAEDEIAYMNNISDNHFDASSQKIVKTY